MTALLKQLNRLLELRRVCWHRLLAGEKRAVTMANSRRRGIGSGRWDRKVLLGPEIGVRDIADPRERILGDRGRKGVRP